MSANLMHLTRKTTSETNKVAVLVSEITYISQTKDSTTLHLRGYSSYIVVVEPYEQVLRWWADWLKENSHV